MADLEHGDSCALYLLEQIPHILTFKDVRMLYLWKIKAEATLLNSMISVATFVNFPE